MKKLYKGLVVALSVALLMGAWQSASAQNDNENDRAKAKVSVKSSNTVNVYKCAQIGENIEITLKKNWPAMTLKAGCRDAGYGKRNYSFSCLSEKNYKVEWEVCPLVPKISQLSVINGETGATLKTANSGYLTLGNRYAAKQSVTVGDNIETLKFNVETKNTVSSGNYSYGFMWVNSASGTINFNESLVKSWADDASFGSSSSAVLNLTNFYRGKFITAIAFMRDNDGVSKIPNMPVEVDDVIAIHVRVLPAINCDNASGGNGAYRLCIGKTVTHVSGATVTYAGQYKNAIAITVNGMSQKFVIGVGKALSFLSPDQRTQVNVQVRSNNQANSNAVSATTTANIQITSGLAPLLSL